MTPRPVSSLPEALLALTGQDILVVQIGGAFYQTTVDGLRSGLGVATSESKGLMSANDKNILDGLNTAVAGVIAPVAAPVSAAASIAIPAGRTSITLSGTTTITAITGMVKNVIYKFSYPAGAGVSIDVGDIDETLRAGDTLLLMDI